MTWKKDYLLIVVAIICLLIYYYRKELKQDQYTQYLSYLPTVGGLAFGINTLINLAK